jgi:hypothetical protein
MGGASLWALTAIQIKTANPITKTIMTDLLHQGESFSEEVFLSTIAVLLLPARRLVVAGFSLRA